MASAVPSPPFSSSIVKLWLNWRNVTLVFSFRDIEVIHGDIFVIYLYFTSTMGKAVRRESVTRCCPFPISPDRMLVFESGNERRAGRC